MINDIDDPNKKYRATTKLKKANVIGGNLKNNALFLEKRVKLFDDLAKEIVRDYSLLMQTWDMGNSQDRLSALNMKQGFTYIDEALNQTIAAVDSYKQGATLYKQANLTKTIRVASSRLVSASGDLYQNLIQFQSNCRSLLAKVDDMVAIRGSSNPDKEDSKPNKLHQGVPE